MTLSSEFQQNPITFLRKYALSPPSGSAGEVIKNWNIATAGNILEGFKDSGTTTLALLKAGSSRVFSDFTKHGLFPACLTVTLSPNRSADDQFCQHWLPWKTLSITKHRIPPIPGSIVGGSENLDDFPRFFMTAGINGCSVFVEGPPESPTVYHAGIDGKLARPAEAFWKEQLSTALGRDPNQGGKPFGQVHSNEYMKRDSDVINRYVEWVSSEKVGPFRIEIVNCFGSVVGVRFGRYWSFYLQQNAFVQDIEILKRSQVERQVLHGGKKSYTMKGTGVVVTREDIVRKRKILPDLKKKIFLHMLNPRCVPIRVSEIYPNRTFHGEFRDLEVRQLGS